MKLEELNKRNLAIAAIESCLNVYRWLWEDDRPDSPASSDFKRRRYLYALTYGLIIHDRILNSESK